MSNYNSIKRRLAELERKTPYHVPDRADDATDQQLVTVLVRSTPFLHERACELGRALRPSDVSDEDLLRIIAEEDEL